MVHDERIEYLNERDVSKGEYVLYWMQRSQRATNNHALEYAIDKANEMDKPLVVFFGLTDDYPDANLRHYRFMLEGLKKTEKRLNGRDIEFVVRDTEPEEGAIEMGKEASFIVTDRGYLKHLKKWRSEVAEKVDCPLVQVETDVVVPVETASEKEEYAARTIRSKIQDKIDEFLQLPDERKIEKSSDGLKFDGLDLEDIDSIIKEMNLDRTVETVDRFQGGTSHAEDVMDDFVSNKLDKYPEKSNDPSEDVLSNLSPYLHFGQISPVRVAMEVKNTDSPGKEEFLEQLIVRRELAINFVHYNDNYDSLSCIPEWAQETLEKHRNDEREYTYTRKEFENGETHDKYWNAAQKEMVKTGKMHGYMRMYWGKKILEWSETPEEAFQTALCLNNKYELDGRDPNGYAGIAWCFGKHDQGWKERPVYGKVRYMNANGLERKFDMDRYLEKVENL